MRIMTAIILSGLALLVNSCQEEPARWNGAWMTDPRDQLKVEQMLGYGGNCLWFFPSGVIAIRFMDEYDLDFRDLVKGIEKIRSSCQ